MLRPGIEILRAKYRLLPPGPIAPDPAAEAWHGADEDDTQYLIKIWPFSGDRPDNLSRALWDAELRNLYRVCSSPGAEDAILVLRDAGVDLDNCCYVMVLEAPGYENLDSALTHRRQISWLDSRDPKLRRDLWTSIQKLASGVQLLHEQQTLHRNLQPAAVFYNGELGARSMRLGGFEWSIRLGTPSGQAPPPSWSSPPELFDGAAFGYRPATDWFGFGMLVVRLLVNVEAYAGADPLHRYKKVLQRLGESTSPLSDLEREFLLRLIARNPLERLDRGREVISGIRQILRGLRQASISGQEQGALTVVIHPPASGRILERAQESGFMPDPEEPNTSFNPNDLLHVARLTDFIRHDLAQPQLYAVPGARFYVLVGSRLTLQITRFEYTDRATNTRVRTWNFAFCPDVAELRWNDGGSACVHLPPGGVVVRTRRDVLSRSIRQDARDWEAYLPTIDEAVALRANLARFHDFIRCTNQLELLIRDSEIFRYRVLNSESEDGLERLVVEEVPRERQAAPFYQMEGGMTEYLLREVESRKRDCDLVVLAGMDQDGLMIGSIPKAECWRISKIDTRERQIHLQRVTTGRTLHGPPSEGTIRTRGMFGQVALIRRRKRAIDRIISHSYLLRSLSSPGQVYMDTGAMPLPVRLNSALVDEAKQAAIRDILRVRPVYALQGPPGTGKTTLVAHLLRQIFEDDPVAQVLITAQAHGAVDVLRAKVRDEAFDGIPEEEQPLAVRLRPPDPDAVGPVEGSVEEVSLRVLERAKIRLQRRAARTPLQDAWLDTVTQMETALRSWKPNRSAPDFCEVVKRGASITYCTTSSGDLEVLADATHTFDWTIVEEAGKAHGFDLALPLQAGHRWLLIGDHKQLPPYRFQDYRKGLDLLGQAVDALEGLPDRAGGLLDTEWIRSWRDREQAEQDSFKAYARHWLKSFERIFESCSVASGSQRYTAPCADDAAAAGVLSRQHRMHPVIGDLISAAYYESELVNRTLDDRGRPLPRVQHPFHLPEAISGKAIVWLDLPRAVHGIQYVEVGPSKNQPRYTNPMEVNALTAFLECLECPPDHHSRDSVPLTLAVLSPYNQQVALINRKISATTIHSIGLQPKQALRSGNDTDDPQAPGRVAHTVDSFQGNQADVIAVSLVRNNTLPTGEGLGFLGEAPRINVLLSRAERLLVLVGSWEFFEYQLTTVALDDLQHPLWHWKKVLSILDEWFESGRALRIDSTVQFSSEALP